MRNDRTLLAGSHWPAIAVPCTAAGRRGSRIRRSRSSCIVPYPPGGNTDIVARLYAQKLVRAPRPAGGDRQPRRRRRRARRGSSRPRRRTTVTRIVIGDLGSMVIGPLANPAVGYDPQKDLAPVGLVSLGVDRRLGQSQVARRPASADFLARAKAAARQAHLRNERHRRARPSRLGVPAHDDRRRHRCTCRSRVARKRLPACSASRSTSSSTAPRSRRSRRAS